MITSTRDKWKNIIRYIIVSQEIIETHDLSSEEADKVRKERFEWLETNYQIAFNQKTMKKLKTKNHV